MTQGGKTGVKDKGQNFSEILNWKITQIWQIVRERGNDFHSSCLLSLGKSEKMSTDTHKTGIHNGGGGTGKWKVYVTQDKFREGQPEKTECTDWTNSWLLPFLKWPHFSVLSGPICDHCMFNYSNTNQEISICVSLFQRNPPLSSWERRALKINKHSL